jgi:hypothetical protein
MEEIDRDRPRDRDRNGAGGMDPEIGRSLGGTASHHRASYSDPTPAAGERLARESDIDEATGQRTPGPGSPEWMGVENERG